MLAGLGVNAFAIKRLRGKITYARMALGGAVTGSWMGLAFGLIFGGQTNPDGSSMFGAVDPLASSMVIGAGLGMLFNVVRYSLARNKKSFVSQSAVVASKYQVQVPAGLADQARAVPAAEAK